MATIDFANSYTMFFNSVADGFTQLFFDGIVLGPATITEQSGSDDGSLDIGPPGETVDVSFDFLPNPTDEDPDPEAVTINTTGTYEGTSASGDIFFNITVQVGPFQVPLTIVATDNEYVYDETTLDPPLEEDTVICFAAGTLVDTVDGPCKVEDLSSGDRVLTQDHGPQAIRWIGKTTVPARGDLAPIRIAAGALGDNTPSQDLLVSPAHRMVITGWRAEVLFGKPEVLVAAKDLVNDDTIRRATDLDTVDYFHVMFDRHEIIYGNGAASESFHPADMAMENAGRAQRAELYRLFPELEADPKSYGPPARMVVSAKEARLITG